MCLTSFLRHLSQIINNPLFFRNTLKSTKSALKSNSRALKYIDELENLCKKRALEAFQLDPNAIHTPGIYVQRIFQGEKYEKRIEQRTVTA